MRRLIALAALFAAAPVAAAGTDRPAARTLYSSRTTFADLLIDPAAVAAADRAAPGVVDQFHHLFGGHAPPPSFGRIISPAVLLRGHDPGGKQATALDAQLARVPVTPAATLARCAGYDQVPPALPATIRRPVLLVFDKITGFCDAPSVDAAEAALRAMAARRGWTAVFSDNGAVFNARDLARFDAVVWNNVSGDALTVPQEQAFQAWLARGGGYAGIHGSGGDPLYLWDWYADTLLGARFIGHPMSPQFQVARVRVADPAHGVTRGLSDWTLREEWYSFAQSPRLTGAHVLAMLDEASYSPVGMGGENLAMGDHPIAWTRCLGNGRAFYTAIGHRPENYAEPHSLALLEQGVAWAMGRGETRCANGREQAQEEGR